AVGFLGRLEGGVDLGRRRHITLHRQQALGRRCAPIGDRHLVAGGGEALRDGQADPAPATGDEYRAAHSAVPPQRSTALAAVMPAPKPTKRTRSPSSIRPASRASASASGMDADDVFPVRWMVLTARSIGTLSRLHAASMMRLF